MTLASIQKHLQTLGNPQRAQQATRFFKTGHGQYGEGDRFLGISVPILRAEEKSFPLLSFSLLEKLVSSPWHEIRLFAWLNLLRRFERGNEQEKRSCYRWLMQQRRWLNNWDLVDAIVPRLIGVLPLKEVRLELEELLASSILWERRIAIVSTLGFIRQGNTEPTFSFAQTLFSDKEDLIHKATGWMLREAGKRDEKALRIFLEKWRNNMPRTALRYAIERFSPAERKKLMDRNG